MPSRREDRQLAVFFIDRRGFRWRVYDYLNTSGGTVVIPPGTGNAGSRVFCRREVTVTYHFCFEEHNAQRLDPAQLQRQLSVAFMNERKNNLRNVAPAPNEKPDVEWKTGEP